MNPRTIVITGASDGIGAAAARELKKRGDQVVIVGRSPDKTRAVAAELDAPFYVTDFADLSQVRALAASLEADLPQIDVLANNAGGIMGSSRQVTTDGFEKTFQVNHLAGFLLTNLLIDTLIEHRATVIQTASMAALIFSKFDIEDLQSEHGYSAQRAYGNAKLENILFTKELQRRYADRGLSAVAFHPGVVGTNFGSQSNLLMRLAYHTPIVSRLFLTSPDRGADQLVWLASSTPGTDWQPGEYYDKRKPGRTASVAADPQIAKALWDRSAQLVDLPD